MRTAFVIVSCALIQKANEYGDMIVLNPQVLILRREVTTRFSALK
jgi:hypothetical protein